MASTRIAPWQFSRDPALVAFINRNGGGKSTRISSGSFSRSFVEDGDRDHDGFAAMSVHLGRGDRFTARVLEDA